jgi:hypothetical protein
MPCAMKCVLPAKHNPTALSHPVGTRGGGKEEGGRKNRGDVRNVCPPWMVLWFRMVACHAGLDAPWSAAHLSEDSAC